MKQEGKAQKLARYLVILVGLHARKGKESRKPVEWLTPEGIKDNEN